MDYINKLKAIDSKIDSIKVIEDSYVSTGGEGRGGIKIDVKAFMMETVTNIKNNPKYAGIIASLFIVVFISLLPTNLSRTTKTVEVYNEEEDETETKTTNRINISKTLLFTTLFYIPVFAISFIVIGLILRRKKKTA